MTEQEYDNLYNEGATDGFNPYRSGRDPSQGEPLWSKIDTRIAKIQRLLNGISDADYDTPRAVSLRSEQLELKALYATLRP